MKRDFDTELIRLFAEAGEPGQGGVFVERVAGRIASRRCAKRTVQVFLTVAGAAILALLTPWVTGLTGCITLGSNVLANGVTAVVFSPIGWVIGGAGGLFIFFRRRP